jgi:hypothetical protein
LLLGIFPGTLLDLAERSASGMLQVPAALSGVVPR